MHKDGLYCTALCSSCSGQSPSNRYTQDESVKFRHSGVDGKASDKVDVENTVV